MITDIQGIVFVTNEDVQEVRGIAQQIMDWDLPYIMTLTSGIDFQTFADMRDWAISRDDEYAKQLTWDAQRIYQ